MIKIEPAWPVGFDAAIRGMRNSMNSWNKMDSYYIWPDKKEFHIGPNDHNLMIKLRNAGTDHHKFMCMIVVHTDITAPLYWWNEFDSYKIDTVSNSYSTMHKIAEKEFTLSDFSYDNLFPWSIDVLQDTIAEMNYYRNIYLNGGEIKWGDTKVYKPKDKEIWWQMIQLLPSSYNQKRTVMLNYEVLANMYESRKNDKLDCWVEFCKWIETLQYSELITGEK